MQEDVSFKNKSNHWLEDLANTSKSKNLVIDLLSKNGNEYVDIENDDNVVLNSMDKFSGIDLVEIHKNQQIAGVASRIQEGKDYRTFTIRTKRWTGAKTEFDKRMEAMSDGYFYPRWTLQAYVTSFKNPELLSVAIIKTKDLYDFIKKYPEKVLTNKSDNEFMIVRWDDLKISGYNVGIK